MEEDKKAISDEFLSFIDGNISRLADIPDTRGIKLSVLDFVKIHTLFMNVDAAILSMAEALFGDSSNKQESFNKFRDVAMSNKMKLDGYFVEVLKKNLDENDGTSE